MTEEIEEQNKKELKDKNNNNKIDNQSMMSIENNLITRKKVKIKTLRRLNLDLPDELLQYDNENEIARQTINEPAPFIENKWNIISNEAKDFVSKCLEKDPKNRMDINEVINHKWLKKYITDEQKNKENKLERLSSFEILKILSQKDIKD